jgi:hypothetical protein
MAVAKTIPFAPRAILVFDRGYPDYGWWLSLTPTGSKQLLKLKTLVGTSENAVETQIWTALTAMLLVKYL